MFAIAQLLWLRFGLCFLFGLFFSLYLVVGGLLIAGFLHGIDIGGCGCMLVVDCSKLFLRVACFCLGFSGQVAAISSMPVWFKIAFIGYASRWGYRISSDTELGQYHADVPKVKAHKQSHVLYH